MNIFPIYEAKKDSFFPHIISYKTHGKFFPHMKHDDTKKLQSNKKYIKKRKISKEIIKKLLYHSLIYFF